MVCAPPSDRTTVRMVARDYTISVIMVYPNRTLRQVDIGIHANDDGLDRTLNLVDHARR
jgi:hypothetical protein